MIAQPGRLLRISLEILLDVFAREFLEPIVVRRGSSDGGKNQTRRENGEPDSESARSMIIMR